MHRDIGRCVDAQTHLVPANFNDRDDDIIANEDLLITLPCQAQHFNLREIGWGAVSHPPRNKIDITEHAGDWRRITKTARLYRLTDP